MQTLKNITTYLPRLQGKRGESKAEKAVRLFFNKAGDIYHNPHQVEVVWLCRDAVYVAVPLSYRDVDEQSAVEVGLEMNDYAGFIKTFGIRDNAKNAIDTITPARLMQLYKEGKAEIFCSVDEVCSKCLYFRKVNNEIVARDEWNRKYEVMEPLETAEQLIEYTKRHYQLDY